MDICITFGLQRDDVREICRNGPRAKREPWLGDVRVKLLISESLCEQYPQEPLGTLTTRREPYLTNWMMSWFLREGTNLEDIQPDASNFSDHHLGTIFEAMIQRCVPRERVIALFVNWADSRFNAGLLQRDHVFGAAVNEQHDDAMSCAVLSEEGSQPEVRNVLSRMHGEYNAKEIEALVCQLPSRSVRMSHSTTKIVSELTQFITTQTVAAIAAANRDLVRELGGVPPLIELLSCPVEPPPPPYDWLETAANAATVLRDLMHNNQRNQDAIREANGVQPLLWLLSHSSSTTAALAADVLGNLTRNAGNSFRANQIAIREAGGIKALVALLSKEPIGEVAVKAASAIKNLVFANDQNRDALHDANGIQPLAALFERRRDCEEDVALIAGAIQNAVHGHQVNKDAILTTAEPLIVQILCTHASSWSERALRPLMAVLYALYSYDDAKLMSMGVPSAMLDRFPVKLPKSAQKRRLASVADGDTRDG